MFISIVRKYIKVSKDLICEFLAKIKDVDLVYFGVMVITVMVG